ncbi:MAG: hypothetical protein PHU25_06825 [Deltaproteobacteria bacterium]|nr:hypothetical protein [Deltaproteobacteria bacterium]
MGRSIFAGFVVVMLGISAGCGSGGGGGDDDSDTGTGTTEDTETGSDAGTDTDADTDADGDSDGDTDGDSDGDTDSGTGGVPGDPDGPYGDCSGGAAGCAVADSICPEDSTGKVCAPSCADALMCPELPGAKNDPVCADHGAGLGLACIVPCSNAGECPLGMNCLFLATEPQCAWE